jgi:glucosamine-6-phosphate deaminase
MNVVLCNNYAEMSTKAAIIIASRIIINKNIVLGLATGSTTLGTYKRLKKMYRQNILDFSGVITFNLDEYCPIDRDNKHSFYFFMQKHLFSQININQNNINIPDGSIPDPEAECLSYDRSIINAGGVDLQLLGIGQNGHIGFNEPAGKFIGNTHIADLHEQTIKDNSRFFPDISQMPRKAMTIGIDTIMNAREILLLASGKNKAEAIKQLIYGDTSPEFPASILRYHKNAHVLLDKEAAALINK